MKEFAEMLLKREAVTLSPDKPYTYTSGIKSPIYCDNRLLLSYPEERDAIAAAIATYCIDADVIAGVATAGIPWAAIAAKLMHKPLAYVRGEAKKHGKANQIEGIIHKGQRVVVVEDLISTGKSSREAINAIEAAGGVVDSVVAIFSYELEQSAALLRTYSVVVMTSFSELIEVAKEEGYLDSSKVDLVKQWNQNPEGWRGAT